MAQSQPSLPPAFATFPRPGMGPPPPLDRIPLGRPPPGVVPNFINPDTIAPAMTIPVFMLLAASIIALGMRWYTRAKILRTIGVDDCEFSVNSGSAQIFQGILTQSRTDLVTAALVWKYPLFLWG